VGVAGLNNEHLKILASIAKIFTNKDQVAQLEQATSVEEILDLFGKVNTK
jgi:PTS system mannitol-specific IIC component